MNRNIFLIYVDRICILVIRKSKHSFKRFKPGTAILSVHIPQVMAQKTLEALLSEIAYNERAGSFFMVFLTDEAHAKM